MRTRIARGPLLLAASLGLACQHAGRGMGELRAPVPGTGALQTKGAVEFRWHSGSDASRGNIEALLPDGRRFAGTFVQPRSSQWYQDYDLYWGVWSGPWGAAGPWYRGPRTGFTTRYGDKALALLQAPDGARMRCEFVLFRPDLGLSGGGQGDCQLSTNEEVFAAVLQQT